MGLYRLEDGSGLVASLLAVQRQTVLHYPTAADRAAQVKNPVYGTLSFLEDSGTFQWWNRAAWVDLVPTASSRTPLLQQATLAGSTVTTVPLTQANINVTAKPYDRMLTVVFSSYGHATGDPSSVWFFTAKTGLGLDGINSLVQRDPITLTDFTVVATASAPLPAGSTCTCSGEVVRGSGNASSWVYSNLGDQRRNRLEVATV